MANDALLQKLQPLRERIDALDHQILELVNQRAQTALIVGEVKKDFNANETILKPEREAAIIRRLQEKNPGPIPNAAVQAIWGELISTCRGLESVLTVAFIGPHGTFSEQAAFKHFGHAINPLLCDSFDEIFRAVEAGQADVGIVPVENSTEGAVNRSLDLLLNTPLKILGERSIPIHHNLLGLNANLADVKRVVSHPQSLAQCQEWLNRNYHQLERIPVASNAEAARLASLDPSCLAIAGKAAADAWGLDIIANGIQDDPQNKTRFLAIGTEDAGVTGKDQTSLILAVPNRAGAVYEMLTPFAKHGVSMTRLESRPARTGQWEYYFYIDLIGHRTDPSVAKALAELRSEVAFFKLLGSYPQQ